MSTLMLASASGPKMRGGDAGPVGDLAQRDLGFVPAIGDAADDLLFHDLILVANDGADFVPGVGVAAGIASGA